MSTSSPARFWQMCAMPITVWLARQWPSGSRSRGQLGLWNFVLNSLYLLGIAFLSVSGVVMWMKRRPAKAMRLATPPRPAEVPFAKGAI